MGEIIIYGAIGYGILTLSLLIYVVVALRIHRKRDIRVTDEEYQEFLEYLDKYKKNKENKKKRRKGGV